MTPKDPTNHWLSRSSGKCYFAGLEADEFENPQDWTRLPDAVCCLVCSANLTTTDSTSQCAFCRSSGSAPQRSGSAGTESNKGKADDAGWLSDANSSKNRLFFALPNFLTLENGAQAPPLTSGKKSR